MPAKPESKLQRRIQQKLREEYPTLWLFKVHGGPFQVAGVPDLVGCVGGLFFAFEVKMPWEGKPSAIQIETVKRIKQAGGIAAFVTSPEEALEILRKALRKTGPRSKDRP